MVYTEWGKRAYSVPMISPEAYCCIDFLTFVFDARDLWKVLGFFEGYIGSSTLGKGIYCEC